MANYYVEYRQDKDDYVVYKGKRDEWNRTFISNHSLKELADYKAKALKENKLLGTTRYLGLYRDQVTSSKVSYYD